MVWKTDISCLFFGQKFFFSVPSSLVFSYRSSHGADPRDTRWREKRISSPLQLAAGAHSGPQPGRGHSLAWEHRPYSGTASFLSFSFNQLMEKLFVSVRYTVRTGGESYLLFFGFACNFYGSGSKVLQLLYVKVNISYLRTRLWFSFLNRGSAFSGYLGSGSYSNKMDKWNYTCKPNCQLFKIAFFTSKGIFREPFDPIL